MKQIILVFVFKFIRTYSNERTYGKSSFYTKNEENSSYHSLGTREEILNQFMNRREDEYIEKEDLKLFILMLFCYSF